jgi:ribosomal protein L37AE/L43A
MEAETLANATRIKEEYNCPSCNGSDLFSPTYKQRKCTDCGHRGTETEFRSSQEADCPECGDKAPQTHETDHSGIYTCRGCYNQFEQ